MAETETHGREVLRIQAIQQRTQLTANPTEKVERVNVRDDLDSQFFIDRASCKKDGSSQYERDTTR